MFLLTVSCFILFHPKHLFYQFLVYGQKPLLYSVTKCQCPTTTHFPSGPPVQARNVPHIWFLFSNHPTYNLPQLAWHIVYEVTTFSDLTVLGPMWISQYTISLYICIPTNCTQLIYFINNTLKHMYCLKL